MIDLELFSTLSSKNAFQPRNSMFLAFLPKGLSTEESGVFFFPLFCFPLRRERRREESLFCFLSSGQVPCVCRGWKEVPRPDAPSCVDGMVASRCCHGGTETM